MVRNAEWPIIEMAIALTPTYSLGPDWARDIHWPPVFSFNKVGRQQAGMIPLHPVAAGIQALIRVIENPEYIFT
jgi:hypothetical protein